MMDKIKNVLANKQIIAEIAAAAVVVTAALIVFFMLRKIPLESITVKQQSIEVNAGDVISQELEFFPNKASNKSVFYKSEDESIVKINDEGLPVALNNGKTVVTVISQENESITGEFEVVVNTKIASINGKQLEKYIEIGDVKQLEYEILPEKTVNKKVRWKSSDENILTVSDTGLVTAVNNGNATVTIQSEENPDVIGKIDVLVETQVSEVFILNEEEVINRDKELQLMIGCLPANAAQTLFAFESSDNNVITVNETGMVKGIGIGEADITLTSKNGKSTVKHLRVAEMPSAVSITGGNISGYVNDTGNISYSLEPADSYAADVRYSSDSDCIEIDDAGNYVMKSKGEATITVSIADGPSASIKAVCNGDRPVPSSSGNTGGKVSVSVIEIDDYLYRGDLLGNIAGVIKSGNVYYNDSFEVTVRNGRITRADVFGSGASLFGLVPGNSGVFAELTMLMNGGASFTSIGKNYTYRDYSNRSGERLRIYGEYVLQEIVYVSN